jgi:hypothetical protein
LALSVARLMLSHRLNSSPRDPLLQKLWREPRYNITARVAHRMLFAAYVRGYCSLAVATIAADVNTNAEAVRQARKKVVKLGIFESPVSWRYKRIMLPGDKDNVTHWNRIQTLSGLDLTYRCAWLLYDETLFGPATLSYQQIAVKLAAPERSTRRAINIVLNIGHFAVDTGGGRFNRNTYHRAGDANVTGIAYPYSPQEENTDYETDEQFYERLAAERQAQRAAKQAKHDRYRTK